MASKVTVVTPVTFDKLSSQVQIRLRTFVYEHDAAVKNADHLDTEVRRVHWIARSRAAVTLAMALMADLPLDADGLSLVG
jgi:aminoglycoside phosphotransferase